MVQFDYTPVAMGSDAFCDVGEGNGYFFQELRISGVNFWTINEYHCRTKLWWLP
jgi:hypothetical protein